MTLEQEYSDWIKRRGTGNWKWRSLTKEQKWFVFMNGRQVPGPKVATAPKAGMLWSKSR